jgi:2-amino-4-hydroxy-6-hydroxymethyldihydropteridine diphosphokinase
MLHRNIFLLLGSNSGDRAGQLKLANEFVEREMGTIVARSAIYETAPWGKTNQPHFLNQALQIESPLSPGELLLKVQLIESTLGRTRLEKWGERSIDIDIIYFGDKIIRAPDLVIPHPHLAERKFVLVPLAEIRPEFTHPVLQKSNAQLLRMCDDPLTVKEFIS